MIYASLKQDTFGVDKFKIYNLRFVAYDKKDIFRGGRYKNKCMVSYQEPDPNGKKPSGIQSIYIEDSNFNLKIYDFFGNEKEKRVELELKRLNNIKPLSLSEVKEKIIDIVYKAQSEYGVDIDYDFNSVYFTNLEVNCTFSLSEPYENYERICDYIRKHGAGKMERAAAEHRNRAADKTYYGGNDSIGFKIYNKTAELNHKSNNIIAQQGVTRAEYTIKKPSNYKDFNRVPLAELSDRQLKDFYRLRWVKDYEKPIDCRIEYERKTLLSAFRRLYEQGYTNYKSGLVKKILELIINLEPLDMDLVVEAWVKSQPRLKSGKNKKPHDYTRILQELHNTITNNKYYGNLKRWAELKHTIHSLVG